VQVTLVPDEKGVDSLTRQIKLSGRAYPLFGIAQLVLRKPDRFEVRFNVVKKADGQVAQPLWVCSLDETLWLSEQEAVNHVFKRFFTTFYQPEKTPADPPKGTYTFVAQCGLSGIVLGPPNYHDYQNKLRKLHGERYAHMPFEAYKSRIRIVRDEAVVKQWLEDQSWKTEYICLNVAEPLKLGSREEAEKHFRENHLANVIKTVESYRLTGQAARQLPHGPLQTLIRRAVDEQARFPLKVVNILSQQFSNRGLQFFKVNKSITHVSVARPHYLDLSTTPVSDGVKRIVDFINATPKCTRRKLLEALAPGATIKAPGETAPAVAAEPSGAVPEPPPSPEVEAIVGDLHWLIHQGHVIEFANGILETAKQPVPRPPKPQPARAPGSETAPKPAEGAGEGGQPVESVIAGQEATASDPVGPVEAAGTEAGGEAPISGVEAEPQPLAAGNEPESVTEASPEEQTPTQVEAEKV
jgi:hypothetical protein